MKNINSPDELIDLYGEIKKVKVIRYTEDKFLFILRVKTEKGNYLEVQTMGDPDNVFSYNPLICRWYEHYNAHIWDIEIIDKSIFNSWVERKVTLSVEWKV